MRDLMDIIKERRSIRAFEDKDVPERVLNQVLESVKYCPSWANTQCWELVLVRDRVQKERLQGILKEKNPATKAITQAPVVIALCGRTGSAGFYKDQAVTKLGDWFMFDLGIAAQTLSLTAHSMGLGSVIVGAIEHDRGREILGIGDGYELAVLIPVGYPAKEPPMPKRREVSEFIHFERY